LLATLLPDPGTPETRKELCEKIGGKLKEITEKGKLKEITEGGILHWKSEIGNKAVLDELREEIRKAYGGRAPRVLDPFAGGGAIPLEAMRLGCDVTAADLNPVAWFILKCTLEYPQKLAGQKRPLPDFILSDREFMESFLVKVHGVKKNSAALHQTLKELGHATQRGKVIQDEMNFESAAGKAGISLEADLAWHVRAWGRKVLAEARKELVHLYPTYAEWHPLESGHHFEPEPMRLIGPNENGVADASALNNDFSDDYLANRQNPRWVAKPTVAYLWARTVTCKNCRATLPLLKTRWLCKNDNKRILLGMEPEPDRSGVRFRIEENVLARGGNAAQKREHDKKLGAGTMSRAGAACPCCPTIMTAGDIRYEGRNGRLGQIMTAVVVDTANGKEYRLPTQHELETAEISEDFIQEVFANIPFGVPNEATPKCGPGASRAFSVDQYGFDQWRKLYTNRQLVALGTLLNASRNSIIDYKRHNYDEIWIEALLSYSTCIISRTVDYLANACIWEKGAEEVKHMFMRWALPITYDFAEANPLAPIERFFIGGINSAGSVLDTLFEGGWDKTITPHIVRASAIDSHSGSYDIVVTDPPYYDAIPYSDLMDFFYIWIRRSLYGTSQEYEDAFTEALSPKWDHENDNGELIDDAGRHKGDKNASKSAYEEGMAKAFQSCHRALVPNGRLVIVFAHKHPDAWETLVSAIIRAGFVVDGSWPIATEMPGGLRNLGRASLASSIWLVCRKRDPLAKAGWDNRVMAEMRENIVGQLREFWDAGIRGPDFVWAATGPAMEAYSQYPAVKKANSPAGELLSVGEFLTSVRRIVVEFVVGRVLHVEAEATDRLDPVTSYYLLHRNDFSFEKAPAGACILYAVSCGLSDAELDRTWNLVKVKGSKGVSDSDDKDSDDDDSEEGGGSEFTLRNWKERKEKRMGYEAPGGRDVPMIDRVHRLMHLWREGDLRKVDDYIDDYALRRNDLFLRVIQSLIELSERGGEERSLLESLSNHFGARSAAVPLSPKLKNFDSED
jgi:adenine-specific DNA methylase